MSEVFQIHFIYIISFHFITICSKNKILRNSIRINAIITKKKTFQVMNFCYELYIIKRYFHLLTAQEYILCELVHSQFREICVYK